MKTPFKDSKIGTWLKDNVPSAINVVENFVPKPVAGALDLVKNLISNDATLTPEQKEEGLKLTAEQELEILKENNRHDEATEDSAEKNSESARAMNISIQTDKSTSWLARNIAYCIDAFIILLWGSLTAYLICVMLNLVKKDQSVDYTAVTAVWGGLTAIAQTIIQFHRGSSAGSKKAGDALEKIASK